MKAFLFSMLFGVLQALLIFAAVKSANRCKKLLVFLFASLMFLTWGAALWLLMFKYFMLVGYLFCGFLCGLPLSGVIIYILCIIPKNISIIPKRRKRRIKIKKAK